MKKRNKKIGKKTQTNSQLTDSPTWVASGETLFLMCGIIGTCDVNAWLKFSESYTLIRPKVHLAVFKKDFMYYNWGNVDGKKPLDITSIWLNTIIYRKYTIFWYKSQLYLPKSIQKYMYYKWEREYKFIAIFIILKSFLGCNSEVTYILVR